MDINGFSDSWGPPPEEDRLASTPMFRMFLAEPSRYPEAESFAEEAMNEAQHPDSKTSQMFRKVVHQIIQLIDFLGSEDMNEIEELYCDLSCTVSELRHRRGGGSGAAVESSEHRVKRQRTESVQQFSNELVLRALQFVPLCDSQKCPRVFVVFPQLSRATSLLSVSSPESLGVLELKEKAFFKLTKQLKPRRLGLLDVECALAFSVFDLIIGFSLPKLPV